MISALKLRGIETIDQKDDRLDRAFAKLSENELADEAGQNNLDIRFRVRPHQIHGDSETVYNGILRAMQLGMVTKDSPGGDIRLKLTSEEAEHWIAEVPGSPDMYRRLAKRFMEYYVQDTGGGE